MRYNELAADNLREVEVDEYTKQKVYDEEVETMKFFNKDIVEKEFHDFCVEFADRQTPKAFYGYITYAVATQYLSKKTHTPYTMVRGFVSTPIAGKTLSFMCLPALFEALIGRPLFGRESQFDKNGVLISRSLSVENTMVINKKGQEVPHLTEVEGLAFNCEVEEWSTGKYRANFISKYETPSK